jgi:hypothetical protein
MDEWLAEARYAFELAVPARYGDQYTMGDIWPPLVKAIKNLGKDLKSELGGAVAAVHELHDLTKIRNATAAHENEFAKEFPRDVMVGIAQTVKVLVSSLYCGKCMKFVRTIPNRASPAMVHCPKHHIQYSMPRSADQPPE